jgi:tetratricopeptide (TPR) repeat protein
LEPLSVAQLSDLANAGHVDEALAGFRERLKTTSSDEEPLIKLGIFSCLRSLGESAEAKLVIGNLLAETPARSETHAWALLAAANLDLDLADWKSAIEKLQRLADGYSWLFGQPEFKEDREEIERKLGHALLNDGKYGPALHWLRRAAVDSAESGPVLFDLGKCRYKLRDYRGAADSLRQALRSEAPSDLLPLVHYYLGMSEYCLGRHAVAVKEYEWVLENDPRDIVTKASLYQAFVYVFQALGMSDEANRYARLLHEAGSSTNL